MSWWLERLPHERWIALGGAVVFLVLYVARIVHYRRLLDDVQGRLHLAPIQVKGGIAEAVGARVVGLLLRDQFARVQHVLLTASQSSPASSYTVQVPGSRPGERPFPFPGDFRTVDLALRGGAVDLELFPRLKVAEDLVLKVGAIEIPIGGLVRMIEGALRVIPIPYRTAYLSWVVHVSVTAVGDQIQLVVYRRARAPRSTAGRASPGAQAGDRRARGAPLLVHRVEVKTLADLSAALRDAAFMILECHDAGLATKKWLSVRCFTEGLGVLDDFRRTGDPRLIREAQARFGEAAEADATFHQAWYFYGTLSLAERTRESIARATMAFERALAADNARLRAFAHTGLANCYAQRIHRLAVRDPRMSSLAWEHVNRAEETWAQSRDEHSGDLQAHPWILATKALVRHVDESGTLDERLPRFHEAARFYGEAIRLDPDNAMFYNNLGWVFLKMAEWGVGEVPDDVVLAVQEERKDPAELAERFLKIAVELYPRNKLAHANLCVLYALPAFRKNNCLDLCWFHGRTAVALDPHYINGHRDVAVSLIAYGRLDEAFVYFQKALMLCGNMDKGREMTGDVERALREVGADEHERRRWQEAALKLVAPDVS